MREIDVRECEALGRSPKDALRNGLRASLSAFTALEGQTPLAMFGIVPAAIMGGSGRIWFLSVDRTFDYRRQMVSFGRFIVAEWLKDFERLENIVAVDNVKALRMLKAWGFSMGGERQVLRGVEFLPFWRERAAIQEPRQAA
jgi:hypothetical protein